MVNVLNSGRVVKINNLTSTFTDALMFANYSRVPERDYAEISRYVLHALKQRSCLSNQQRAGGDVEDVNKQETARP